MLYVVLGVQRQGRAREARWGNKARTCARSLSLLLLLLLCLLPWFVVLSHAVGALQAASCAWLRLVASLGAWCFTLACSSSCASNQQ